jgi:hypothetical protein
LPQLLISVCRFTQALEHNVCPLGQTQEPLLHVVPEGQTCPHAPQFFGSVCVCAQKFPLLLGQQTVLAAQQRGAQQIVPAAQQPPKPLGRVQQIGWLPEHVPPHLPQLFGSFFRLVQAPLQQFGEAAGHCFPHCPQLPASELVLTQAPPHAVVPLAQTHCPPAQCWLLPHFCPQPPQLFGSLLVLTQMPLQSDWPIGQPQWPPAQPWPPLHAWPQPPQFCESVCRFTQLPPQAVNGAGHSSTQAPWWHWSPLPQP